MHIGQPQVLFHQGAVARMKQAQPPRLQPERFHRLDPREGLLVEACHLRQLLLDRQMPPLDAMRKPRETADHQRHQQQDDSRQHRVQAEHHPERQKEHEHHAAVLHQALAHPHPHLPHVRRQPVHQVARVLPPEIAAVQRGQMIEQIPPDVRLHLMPHPQRNPAHPIRQSCRRRRRRRIHPQPAQQTRQVQVPRRQSVDHKPRNERNPDIEPHCQQRQQNARRNYAPVRHHVLAQSVLLWLAGSHKQGHSPYTPPAPVTTRYSSPSMPSPGLRQVRCFQNNPARQGCLALPFPRKGGWGRANRPR